MKTFPVPEDKNYVVEYTIGKTHSVVRIVCRDQKIYWLMPDKYKILTSTELDQIASLLPENLHEYDWGKFKTMWEDVADVTLTGHASNRYDHTHGNN